MEELGMTTKEKVRQFLEEAEIHKHYSSIVESTLTYFISKAEKEGNARLADDLRKAMQGSPAEFNAGIEITEQVYAELFTDEELNELIVLNSNPTLKKARSLTAEIFNSTLDRLLKASA